MSRTVNALKNTRVAMIFYVVDMLLGFISRKVFIDYIGAEVLGLNTTANNLLQFLNLAELGISAAVAFTLYAPLSENDKTTIKEILQVQGWLYRRVALIVMLGAAVLMMFFPWFFAKSDLPLWYSFASFGVLLYTSLLTYFFNYKQIILTASQQEYKVMLSYKSVLVLKSIVQILAMWQLSDGYVWWLVIQVVFGTLATINLCRCVDREFPYLKHLSLKIPKSLRQKHSVIIVKIRQLFIHKFAAYILSQTSPLVIYGFTTLTMVAIYGNYMLIVFGVTMLLQAVFNSVSAGVGDLVASKDNNRIWMVFKELFTSRFLIATGCCFCIYMFANSFIRLWVGADMLLDNSTLLVIVLIAYVSVFRTVVDSFISAYGLFADVWAPLAESILNITLSIVLGKLFGITGILSGVLISLVLIVCIWKPVYLFHWAMKRSIFQYLKMYAVHIFAFSLTVGICIVVLPLISLPQTNFFYWAIDALMGFIIFMVIECGLLLLFTKEMRLFIHRMYHLFLSKK